MLSVSLIAAMAKDRVIGMNNKMPWHLPADLMHFKKVTLGKPIIMGRKTFDSIGRPLPGRENIVLTRNPRWSVSGVTTKPSLESALDYCEDESEVMIIGGANVYAQAIPFANRMYLTFIDLDVSGDAYFPFWMSDQWTECFSESHDPCEKNPYAYRFVCLER